MAFDTLVDKSQLENGLTEIADAIRAKTGDAGKIAFNEMATKISGIESGAAIETCSVNLMFDFPCGERYHICYSKSVNGEIMATYIELKYSSSGMINDIVKNTTLFITGDFSGASDVTTTVGISSLYGNAYNDYQVYSVNSHGEITWC